MMSSGNSVEETPVPIPNTEVKLYSADGSSRESRTPLGNPFFIWRFSSAGRASALQAEGHRFEPVNLHHLFCVLLAQLVEHLTFNQRVRGSNPLQDTIFKYYAGVAELVDALDLGSSVLVRKGSSPFTRTSFVLRA